MSRNSRNFIIQNLEEGVRQNW